ncbi:MAG: site-2 protease family protein [Planctomycetes bacterium]|nr:site-2 protease family protein [Planctomycetota bacterium]
MNTSDADRQSQFDDSSPIQDDRLEWLDQQRRLWYVDLSSDAVVLTDTELDLTIPSENWSRDIYAAPHGQSFIIRFETFDLSVAFVVTADQAALLLTHIGRSGHEVQEPVHAQEEPRPARPLMWPKVSPLAVWAVMSASLVFIPVLGVIPAVATIVLLWLHRKRVGRTRAWDHSRAVCTTAFVFLFCGAIVSALATAGWLRFSVKPTDSDPIMSVSQAAQPTSCAEKAGMLGFFDTSRFENVNWGLVVAALVVVLLSLTVHEAAHATTAWWLGDDFARSLGRVTLNPLAHIDPFGTVLLPLILYFANAGVFGFARPVPVRTEHLAKPHRAQILIAIAGPGSNLLMAAASLAILLGLGTAVSFLAPGAQVANYSSFDFSSPVTASGFVLASVFGPLCTILKLSFMVNVFLAFFNLIPIPPLDGSWVLEHLFPRTLGPFYSRIRPYGFLLFLLLIYSNSNILGILLLPAILTIAPGFALLSLCTTIG